MFTQLGGVLWRQTAILIFVFYVFLVVLGVLLTTSNLSQIQELPLARKHFVKYFQYRVLLSKLIRANANACAGSMAPVAFSTKL